VAPGVPQTAIAFYAVGSGTQLDHIYAQYGNDDGIEFYGGTADLRYGLAVGNEDECFDSQYGWTGRGQFLVGLQTGDVGNRGFQVGDSPSYEPPTHPTISNMTLVGFRSARARTDNGVLISEKAGLNFYNSIVQGWDDAALEFGSEFASVVIDRCAFYDNPNNVCECEGMTCPCASIFGEPFVNVESSEPLLVDPRLLDLPDLRGIEQRLPEAIDPHTIDPWFDSVDFVGAVPPEGNGLDWTHEPWISWLAH
jgi:hypothetical protein